jgi:hypothetical protein
VASRACKGGHGEQAGAPAKVVRKGKASTNHGPKQGIGVTHVELGAGDQHAVGQKLAQLGLGPLMHDGVNDLVQVCARTS